MLKVISAFTFLLFISSCSLLDFDKDNKDDNDNNKNNCAQQIVVSQSMFDDADETSIHLQEISYNGECMSITIGYSGCNDGHNIDVVTDGSIDESFPPQMTFGFFDHDEQDCEAYFIETYEVGLGDLAVFGEYEQIILHFKGSDKSFTLEP